eukprot:757458-Hanusia_phi.AAC.17
MEHEVEGPSRLNEGAGLQGEEGTCGPLGFRGGEGGTVDWSASFGSTDEPSTRSFDQKWWAYLRGGVLEATKFTVLKEQTESNGWNTEDVTPGLMRRSHGQGSRRGPSSLHEGEGGVVGWWTVEFLSGVG